MNAYVNSIPLPQSSLEQLSRDGYVKLEGLFTPGAVEGFRMLLADELGPARNLGTESHTRAAAGGEFARYSNNVDIDGSLMQSVRDSAAFRSICTSIDDGEWIMTQGLGFEIQPGLKGLAWHFGFRSFCFIDPADQGLTLWIPLDPVDPQRQNGGLPVVSETVYSGREETKLLSHYFADPNDVPLLQIAHEHLAGFAALRNGLLEKRRVDIAFQPGDALLFNRYVFHRSAEFLEGPQTRRRAVVTRLIPASAKFNPRLFHNSEAIFRKFKMHTHEAPVADRLTDLQPGDPLGKSRFLAKLF